MQNQGWAMLERRGRLLIFNLPYLQRVVFGVWEEESIMGEIEEAEIRPGGGRYVLVCQLENFLHE